MKRARLASILVIVVSAFLASVQIAATAGIGQQKKKRAPKIFRPPSVSLSDRLFEIRGLGNRCIDLGGQQWWTAHAPVIIFPCNRSLAQQIRVVEIDASHDVTLRTANSSFCLGVAAQPGDIRLGSLLELQTCNGSPVQRFALDGDSIMMGNQGQGQRVSREFVIETVNRSTQERTRLYTNERDVSDAQYFRLFVLDGSNARPTSGFVSVADEVGLDSALTRGWGTVIEVTRSMALTNGAKLVAEGVTIRGYRKFTDNGPEIYAPPNSMAPCDKPNLPCPFILQNNTRITSLRLRGPKNTPLLLADGIFMRDNGQFTNVTIDHIDASDWTGAGIHIAGALGGDLKSVKDVDSTCDQWHEKNPSVSRFTYPRLSPVKILGNIVHNNPTYGVLVDAGANPRIRGNLLFWHTHSIVADAHPGNGYVALDNLFTRWIIPGQPASNNSVFDVHGTGNPEDKGSWSGGVAGDVFDIGWNTVLSNRHPIFKQRGTPCHETRYHENVSVQGPGKVITESKPPTTLIQYANKFNSPDPLDKLGVGDFDGDGRTDVLSVPAAGKIMISWAGMSPWTTTPATAQTINDIAVGNFDGDHRDDVFIADGAKWTYAAGGMESKYVAQSNLRPTDLRFGDFNNDRKTDILFVSGNDWRIIKGGGPGTSEFLRVAITPTVQRLVVADFDGDSYADIALDLSGKWMYSTRGVGGLITLRNAPSGQKIVDRYVGNFDGNKKADVIVWDSVWFAIAPGVFDPVLKISWQGMR